MSEDEKRTIQYTFDPGQHRQELSRQRGSLLSLHLRSFCEAVRLQRDTIRGVTIYLLQLAYNQGLSLHCLGQV